MGLLFPDPTYLEDAQTIAKIGLHASSMLQVLILKKVFAAREVMLGLDFHYYHAFACAPKSGDDSQ